MDMNAPKTKLDPQVAERMKAMRREGQQYKDIAAAEGVALSTVQRYVHGVRPDLDAKPSRLRDGVNATSTVTLELPAVLSAGREFALGSAGAGLASEAEVAEFKSMKALMLQLVVENDGYGNVRALLDDMRGKHPGNLGTHEVTHVLYALQKQGLVKAQQDRRSRGTKTPLLSNIQPTKAGIAQYRAQNASLPLQDRNGTHPAGYSRARHAVGRDDTQWHNHGSRAQGGPIERTQVEPDPWAGLPEVMAGQAVTSRLVEEAIAREAEQENAHATIDEEPVAARSWPELQRLRDGLAERLRLKAEGDARATKLLEAAASLEGVDDDLSKDLLARAEREMDAVEDLSLTAVEAEYLRFAEAQRG